MSLKYFILFMGTVLSLQLPAESIIFNSINAGGVGCEEEKTQKIFSPDKTVASLIFSSFESKVPSNNSKGSMLISEIPCNMFLQLKVPVGVRLDSIEVGYDMRGNVTLDSGVSGTFKSFYMGATGLGLERSRNKTPQMISEKNWNNTSIDQMEDFLIHGGKTIPVISGCRSSRDSDLVVINLQHHIRTQILSTGPLGNTSGGIVIDTSDLSGGVKIKLNTSICSRIGTDSRGTGSAPILFPRVK